MTYILRHLLISRGEYQANKASGLYDHPGDGLSLTEAPLDLSRVRSFIERVGGPYGWPQRQQYGTDEAVASILRKPRARLFVLEKDDEPIGYCLIHDEDIDLRDRFGYAVADETVSIGRIEGFGLFPEHTDDGYGRWFLPQIFEILFADHNYTYLTSRSTNHPGVIPFYESLGMRVIHSEELPDDYMPDPGTEPAP